jgi:DNA-binding GntR family transcriptional regulator
VREDCRGYCIRSSPPATGNLADAAFRPASHAAALRQLETEGLVTFNPHRGAIVSSLSLEEIEEVFDLRATIEPDLLRRAMPHLTIAQLDHADDVLDRYAVALRTGDVSKWGLLNWQFHANLYAPAERPITMGILQRLHQQSDRYLRMQLARQLVRDHIAGAGRSLLAFPSGKARGGHESQRVHAGARGTR